MAHFPDLSVYTYHPEEIIGFPTGTTSCRPGYERLNVGWLDAPHEFETGTVADGFADALLDIIAGRRINQMRGFHVCTLCPAQASPGRPRSLEVVHRSRTLYLGSSEIRVPSGPGTMFAAPTLIWHYVTAHGYRPPDVFVLAVHGYDPEWTSGPWVPADADRRDSRGDPLTSPDLRPLFGGEAARKATPALDLRPVPVQPGLVLDNDAVGLLRDGLGWYDMEIRWMAHLDDSGVLRLWRSWKGQQVYEARLVPGPDGATLTGLTVEQDPSRHQGTLDREPDLFERVLRSCLDHPRRFRAGHTPYGPSPVTGAPG
ncbi:hypothetical protein KZ829_13920 [Actinoplanes hulinensis]|uniref:DUF7919 domain-containing protein n=1 Tax=Actinoplanes hulinensis TaxID=1144547 RepID=A0ABS7B1H5_9ACTN|nr:hypothetical protein [Actinoplanes hulinensis]MBW6434835.1 hypothetical protein [Actinoplanes hulinensis]